ncbi:MAG: N-acetylglucosamine-6-phosphate deacetylase [Ginsengibacter sp.]
MVSTYYGDKVFTGINWLTNTSIICEDRIIKNIIPGNEIGNDKAIRYPIIAPAFIDVQIYGASSKLFSVFPSADTLELMYHHCVNGGTSHFLPTIATNTSEILKQGIDAIRSYWDNNGKGVIGLHIEGPWINKVKRGAHVEHLIHHPDLEEARSILEYGKDVIKIITLAPEVCATPVIDLIKSYNIIISAGHSNATYSEAMQAFDGGIKASTHLFNAMTPLHHREPGFAAATLMHPNVMSSIVPDGIHVDFDMVRLAKNLMGERLFIITDAVTETNEGPYMHERVGDKYESNGILSGSALTMAKGVKNLVEKCQISLEEALKMASLYPAKAIGLNKNLGKIEKGFGASLVMLNEDADVLFCI